MSEFPIVSRTPDSIVPTSNYVNMHNHRSYHLPRCTLTWIPKAVHSHGFLKLYNPAVAIYPSFPLLVNHHPTH